MMSIVITTILVILAGAFLLLLIEMSDDDVEDLLENRDETSPNDPGNTGTDSK